uniref:ShKT domain-containing protein n=1 Tax=Haemonchus contortus TaxID=6289 RepID=A0A7I4YQM0_HAECO
TINSAASEMFFYIVCALLLLNAYTTEAAVTTEAPCVDRGGEAYCSEHTGSPDYICTNVMKYYLASQLCAKSCGVCI